MQYLSLGLQGGSKYLESGTKDGQNRLLRWVSVGLLGG